MARALLAAALLAATLPARADTEAPNEPIVAADPTGRCYAKSVPRHQVDPWDRPRGEGQTEVYRVNRGADDLIMRYGWYARVLVLCGRDRSADPVVVRIGPWTRGETPNDEDLAVALYHGSKLVKRYSTLDIAGGAPVDAKRFVQSVSHYQVMEGWPELVYRWAGGSNWIVRMETVDGRKLVLDLETGEMR
jgi:hypothetical protein